MSFRRLGSLLICAFVAFLPRAFASDPATAKPRALIIVAHPDDESCFAATTFRIARELGGVVDQLVITNGEAGYKYSGPAEYIYGKKLTDEATARKALPRIRKKELLRSGKIVGIRDHIFLDQRDFGYTTDPAEAFSKWDRKRIDGVISNVLRSGKYDLVLTLLPTPETHGHHKAATIFALDAVAKISPKERPLVLGCANAAPGAVESIKSFHELEGFPETHVLDQPVPTFDRSSPFGYKDRLNYRIYATWMMAEHKSQGLLQTDIVGPEDLEVFRVFDTGNPDDGARALQWMKRIIPSKPSG